MPVLRRQPRRPSLLQDFAEQDGGWFAGASGRVLLLAAVDQAVEESAGGDDDGLGADGAAVAKADADGSLDARRRWSLVAWSLAKTSLSSLGSVRPADR